MLKSTGAAVGVVWVSTLVVVMSSVWVSASSSRTAPQRSSRAWAAIDRQSPAPCPSVSHFRRSSSFPSCVPSSYPSPRPLFCASSTFPSAIFHPALYPSSCPSPHFLLPSSYPASYPSCLPSSCPVFFPVPYPSSKPCCHPSSFASSNSIRTSSWL